MKEGIFMQDGCIKPDKKQVVKSFLNAMFDTLVVLSFMMLYYYNMHVEPTDSIALNHILSVFCAFMSGFNLNRTVRSWKIWHSSHKEFKAAREEV